MLSKQANSKAGMRQHLCKAIGSVRLVRTRAASITEVSVFLEEIAVSQTPKRLASLVKVLQVGGARAVTPIDRHGLHPLLIPISSTGSNPDTVTCLLRFAQPSLHPGMCMPVVTMQRGARNMKLIARSVDEYLHRLLAEEDLAAAESGSSARAAADAAGEDGLSLYRTGEAAAGGFTGTKASLYVIRKAGKYPDVCENLAYGHLNRGDKTSALVASEWYMRNNFFPGWSRPYEFAAELFTQLGRDEEARDMARIALRLPWWSLTKEVSEVQAVAALGGRSPEELKYTLSEEAAAAQATLQGNARAPKEQKTPQQLALEKADLLMDLVAAGSLPDYEGIRGELAEAYTQAGLTDVANFITAAS